MPNPPTVERLGRRLLLQGLPVGYIRQTVQEISEHWEDLKTDGLDEGLSISEAESRATAKLGDPDFLAMAIASKLKNGSWIGRYRLISFCLLPFAALILWWASCVGLAALGTGAWQWSQDRALAEPDWVALEQCIHLCKTGAGAIVPLLFCWLAIRSCAGFRWAVVACAVLALHNGFQFTELTLPGADGTPGFSVGYAFYSHWLRYDPSSFALPLIVCCGFLLVHLHHGQTSLKVKL